MNTIVINTSNSKYYIKESDLVVEGDTIKFYIKTQITKQIKSIEDTLKSVIYNGVLHKMIYNPADKTWEYIFNVSEVQGSYA